MKNVAMLCPPTLEVAVHRFFRKRFVQKLAKDWISRCFYVYEEKKSDNVSEVVFWFMYFDWFVILPNRYPKSLI